jgi:NAD(P)-dependent dehydrogenase (short-subunit alcohol dehydrogenase family)
MIERKRVVLITGAGGGIGSAAVRVFSEAGWRVIGVDRREIDRPESQDGIYIQSDISLEENVRYIYDRAREFSPVLDAVVNNAAVQICKPILETSAEEWDLVMRSNLRSVFLGVKMAHPLLVAAGGGAIVNVSSVHAVATSMNISAYAASKGGLLALTRALAIEFAPQNVRVNAVLPGAVDTPMLRAGLDRGHLDTGSMTDRLDNLARKTVNGRIGKPEEIAHAIYFLADGKQSSFMTGQAMIVDGGATARLSTE